MSKKIYLCRHAQAEHNVADDYSIPDAPLTALGKSQAAALAQDARLNGIRDEIQLVVSSALKRTLQTTKMGWPQTVAHTGGLGKVICLPQLQECNAYPCDTGSPREVLEQDVELAGFDFPLLTPDWNSKQGIYAADPSSLNARARWVRQWLRARPESVIVCIAHGDILRRITGRQYSWKNAEVQLWTFDESEGAAAAAEEAPVRLVEYITAEGRAESISSDAAASASNGGAAAEAETGASGVSLPNLASSGSFDLSKELDSAAKKALAEIEERVKAKADVVQSKANELQALEARLAAAEKRKAELEAKGIKV
ncbi:phosphoglycerate mutase-like protein [Tilletiaria anomala UBC 951]|uniref:Phosphoglycerate mutase-like protein n=1 Tax=Tilletiaria anomala (strain ATCC 24038 / CBS 436.72 / UBC 951) TaxID=1037660 RepID=A0A066VCE5_TILAU|nr:phosphoglycerate mutase-like protein [Tilletiaria anomala UBC 951]KDN39392.1 phosphoglycerate mutase-like protein [Tilletiaria anomala UBC 951]